MRDTDGRRSPPQGQEPAPPAAASSRVPPCPSRVPPHAAWRAAPTPATCCGKAEEQRPFRFPWKPLRPGTLRPGSRRSSGLQNSLPRGHRQPSAGPLLTAPWPTRVHTHQPCPGARPSSGSLCCHRAATLVACPGAQLPPLRPPHGATRVPSCQLHREAASVRLPPPRGVWAHAARFLTHTALTATSLTPALQILIPRCILDQSQLLGRASSRLAALPRPSSRPKARESHHRFLGCVTGMGCFAPNRWGLQEPICKRLILGPGRTPGGDIRRLRRERSPRCQARRAGGLPGLPAPSQTQTSATSRPRLGAPASRSSADHPRASQVPP